MSAPALTLDIGPLCVDNPDLWFSTDPHDIAIARTICAACPLRAECLQQAIIGAETHGVWGGVDMADKGRKMRRDYDRARRQRTHRKRVAA